MRDTNPRRLTFAPTVAAFPVWATNERFLYMLGRGSEGGVYEQTLFGQPRLLFNRSGEFPLPTSATGQGRAVVFTTVADPAMGADIWIWTDKDAPLITREGDQTQAQLSADGRWLAYVSNETGRDEVFVAAFRFDESTGNATVGDSVPVSAGGGFAPRWRGDGKELFYLKIDGSVMAIEATAAPAFSPGPAAVHRPGRVSGMGRDTRRQSIPVRRTHRTAAAARHHLRLAVRAAVVTWGLASPTPRQNKRRPKRFQSRS
jgi:hypothetical protein